MSKIIGIVFRITWFNKLHIKYTSISPPYLHLIIVVLFSDSVLQIQIPFLTQFFNFKYSILLCSSCGSMKPNVLLKLPIWTKPINSFFYLPPLFLALVCLFLRQQSCSGESWSRRLHSYCRHEWNRVCFGAKVRIVNRWWGERSDFSLMLWWG